MMFPLWNKFLQSLLYFVVVMSDHNEGLARINLPQANFDCFLVWKIEISFSSYLLVKGRRKKTQKRRRSLILSIGMLHVSFGHMFSACSLIVCLGSSI
jgi:hypothetical protein